MSVFIAILSVLMCQNVGAGGQHAKILDRSASD